MFKQQAVDWLKKSLNINSNSFDIKLLKGATSSSVYLLQFPNEFPASKYVLRVFDNLKWLNEEPDIPIHEANALIEANKAGISAPLFINYSTKGEEFGTPVLLMSYIEGAINLQPTNVHHWLNTLAIELANIHKHPAKNFSWQFQSWVKKEAIGVPSWTKSPKIWQKAIEIVLSTPPQSETVFIHRDYHPTNVLWKHDKITGIVDWVNACQGPAGVDVAHCRTNLVLMFGNAYEENFLEFYQKAAPNFIYEPYWDIDSVLDMCWPEPTFYQPWQEFGIPFIDKRTLQQRIDNYLMQLVSNLNNRR